MKTDFFITIDNLSYMKMEQVPPVHYYSDESFSKNIVICEEMFGIAFVYQFKDANDVRSNYNVYFKSEERMAQFIMLYL